MIGLSYNGRRCWRKMAYYEDITLQCKDCGNDFTFTGGERAFYEKNGFSQPKRCPDCRKKKKEQQR